MKLQIQLYTTVFLIITILCVLLYCSNFQSNTNITKKTIEHLTDEWINRVSVEQNPQRIADMFCSDGNLVGTVSRVKRKGVYIKKYFNYFAKLDDIKVVNTKYHISKVTNNVFLNTAFITWTWSGLESPITARMTFLFRDHCIFQLHSSALPDINKKLFEISGSK